MQGNVKSEGYELWGAPARPYVYMRCHSRTPGKAPLVQMHVRSIRNVMRIKTQSAAKAPDPRDMTDRRDRR